MISDKNLVDLLYSKFIVLVWIKFLISLNGYFWPLFAFWRLHTTTICEEQKGYLLLVLNLVFGKVVFFTINWFVFFDRIIVVKPDEESN